MADLEYKVTKWRVGSTTASLEEHLAFGAKEGWRLVIALHLPGTPIEDTTVIWERAKRS